MGHILAKESRMRRVRFAWVAGVSVLAVALALVDSRAAVDDATNAAINKLADLIEKGDKEAARKQIDQACHRRWRI